MDIEPGVVRHLPLLQHQVDRDDVAEGQLVGSRQDIGWRRRIDDLGQQRQRNRRDVVVASGAPCRSVCDSDSGDPVALAVDLVTP